MPSALKQTARRAHAWSILISFNFGSRPGSQRITSPCCRDCYRKGPSHEFDGKNSLTTYLPIWRRRLPMLVTSG